MATYTVSVELEMPDADTPQHAVEQFIDKLNEVIREETLYVKVRDDATDQTDLYAVIDERPRGYLFAKRVRRA